MYRTDGYRVGCRGDSDWHLWRLVALQCLSSFISCIASWVVVLEMPQQVLDVLPLTYTLTLSSSFSLEIKSRCWILLQSMESHMSFNYFINRTLVWFPDSWPHVHDRPSSRNSLIFLHSQTLGDRSGPGWGRYVDETSSIRLLWWWDICSGADITTFMTLHILEMTYVPARAHGELYLGFEEVYMEVHLEITNP